VVPDYQHEAIRELIVGDYRLIYRLVGDEVRILTVMHGSRDLMLHLPDGPWDIQ
jgi:plasmid stabilization system protein ParE